MNLICEDFQYFKNWYMSVNTNFIKLFALIFLSDGGPEQLLASKFSILSELSLFLAKCHCNKRTCCNFPLQTQPALPIHSRKYVYFLGQYPLGIIIQKG